MQLLQQGLQWCLLELPVSRLAVTTVGLPHPSLSGCLCVDACYLLLAVVVLPHASVDVCVIR